MNFRGLTLALLFAAAGCSGGPAAPGEDAFNNANQLITVHKSQTAFGNGPEAIKAAEKFASMMKAMRRMAFSEGKGPGPLLTGGEFLTYCHLTDDALVFLVHVPELRNFKEQAQEALLEIAWQLARSTAKTLHGDRNVKLGVGLRGVLLYGAQAIGSTQSDKPERQDTTSPVELEAFYPFFVGTYPAAAAAAAAAPASR